MSLDHPYQPDNIFARIINGALPCVRVYEDRDSLAFMDLFPQSEGHVLVISKTATAVNLLDIEADDLHHLISAVQRIAIAMRAALTPAGLRIAQFNGEAAGQTVFHLHFHLIPVYHGAPTPKPHSGATGAPVDNDALEIIAAKIRAAL